MGTIAGEAALADRHVREVDGSVVGCQRGKRAATAGREYIDAECPAADAALHRLPLREAGHGAQDHSERSATTVCDAIVEQRRAPGSTAGKCLASDASRIQSGTVCRRARQSADPAHGPERRHFPDGKRCRAHPRVPRHDRRRETRAVSRIRQRTEAALRFGVLSSRP